MVHAFIMVETDVGAAESTLDAVRSLRNVTEAHIVAGTYDLIAEASAEAVYELLNTSAGGIQGLDGVTDTKTYISMDE